MMSLGRVRVPRTARHRAQLYFGVQSLAGALWWVLVFAFDDVRTHTLGYWDPALVVAPDVVVFVAGSGWAAVTANRYVAAGVAIWTAVLTSALTTHALIERIAGWGVVAMALATVGSAVAATTIWMRRAPLEWFFIGPFKFRVAEERAGALHLRRSLAQLVVFWSVFFVVIPLVLVAVEDRLRLRWSVLDSGRCDAAGVSVFAVGSAVGLWSCVTMAVRGAGTPLPAETARHLVVSGPYRYVRNPMAVAGVAQTVGVGLWCGSWMVIAIAFIGATVWNVMIRPTEEADLAARFGDPYRCYSAQVRCWIPGRRWRSPDASAVLP